MSKPNILLLMTDQQRWDAMDCSGGWVKTPHLDRIATEGIRFTNCITNSPVCVPARVSLATGRYPHNTGVWNNTHFDMPSDTPTWMQAIRDAGYRTSLFGKTHLHHHSGDLREREHLLHSYGLQDTNEIGGPRASARILSHMTAQWEQVGVWKKYQEDYSERFANKPHVVRPSTLPLEQYADVYVGQKAKQYLRDYQGAEPWFCWVSFGGPHEPWDAPEPYASMYRPEDMPNPIPKPMTTEQRPRGLLDKKLENAPDLSQEEVAAMRANYAGNISLIDDQIGEILQTLTDRGELENTVIVFCSDHGEMNGDYGLIYKETSLNGSIRVPLLVRTPETIRSAVSGTVSESLVEWFDIGPTLVECAHGKLEHQQFAKSLCPQLCEQAPIHREFVISELHGEIYFMDKKWKMALNDQGVPYLLFDLTADPDEQHNLVTETAAKDTILDIRLRIQEHLVKTQVML